MVRARTIRTAEGRRALVDARTGAPIAPRVDPDRLERTTAADIAGQAAADDAAALRDVAAHVRRVRRRTGLSRAVFAARIGVPVETLAAWERGEGAPEGPARALLRVIDRAPEAALAALD